MKTILTNLRPAWLWNLDDDRETTSGASPGRREAGIGVPTFGYAAGGAAVYESLLLKAMGDRTMIERLVGYEERRCPGLSRPEALDRANRRWERDLNR